MENIAPPFADQTARPWSVLFRWLLFPGVFLFIGNAAGAEHEIEAPPQVPYQVWPSQPPNDCPFAPSRDIVAVAFTGRNASYTSADTWYPSWASDGNLYSPWTDGTVEGVHAFSGGDKANTGFATIIGDDPLKLVVTNAGIVPNSPAPYGGRYPCGSLVANGVWFYGTYCLIETPKLGLNWDVLGPFVGFRWSTNFGKTWTDTPHTPAQPLFSEPKIPGGKVKMGAPHFVDFGKNLEHSPDGKAYLVGHGAADPDPQPRPGNLSWITGDQIYLARVSPTIAEINDGSRYEFFAGNDSSGEPSWVSDFAKIKPLVEWNNRCGCVTMTYDPPLKKFLMCITDGGNTISRFNSYILEADRITGPWKLATFLKNFGEQAYFVNIPSRFLSADGRSAWLCYAANFTGGWASDPPGSRYGMCLQEIRLLKPTDPVISSPLLGPNNVARKARVTVSSTHPDYKTAGMIDGVVGGFPGEISFEWATRAEKETALVRLTWKTPQTIDRVWLFDRPNSLDQITSGLLVFSDGSTLKTGPLPDDGRRGLEVVFPARQAEWLAFFVTGVKKSTANIGLSEMAVFSVAPEK